MQHPKSEIKKKENSTPKTSNRKERKRKRTQIQKQATRKKEKEKELNSRNKWQMKKTIRTSEIKKKEKEGICSFE